MTLPINVKFEEIKYVVVRVRLYVPGPNSHDILDRLNQGRESEREKMKKIYIYI